MFRGLNTWLHITSLGLTTLEKLDAAVQLMLMWSHIFRLRPFLGCHSDIRTCSQDFTEGNHCRLALLPYVSSYFYQSNFKYFPPSTLVTQSIQRKITLRIQQNEIDTDSTMDLKIQVKINRQQSHMLEKLSTTFDNKMENMKQQLEDVSSKAHESHITVYWWYLAGTQGTVAHGQSEYHQHNL